MFCPKCGTQNPETGKFCRTCGTDLGDVSAIMSGAPVTVGDAGTSRMSRRAKRRQDPGEVQSDALKNIITGIGFLIIGFALLISGIGHSWWWSMIFPSVYYLAKGIPDYIRYERMLADRSSSNAAAPQPLTGQPQENYALPPNQTGYVSPQSPYKTEDLVPPSVTDGTTRHLEINSEGETMTLPKKP